MEDFDRSPRIGPCREVFKDSIFQRDPIAKARWEELHALQAQKHWRAADSSWWLARSYEDRDGGRRCRVRKDRRRTSKGNIVARKFGNNDAAGTLSRRRCKSEQGEHRHSLSTETVGYECATARRTASGTWNGVIP